METGHLLLTAEQEPVLRTTPVVVCDSAAVWHNRIQRSEGRRTHVYAPRPAALAVTVAGPTVTRLVQPTVQDQAALYWLRQQHHGSIIQNRWSGYQWVGLPPVPPLIEPHVQRINEATTERRHTHGSVIEPRPAATGVTITPTKSVVQSLIDETAPRRHPGRVVAPRWQAYQWAGLPPVSPLVEPHVQSILDETTPRRHTHGSVIAPAMQLAAASGTTPPAAPRLILPVVQSIVAELSPRRHTRGGVIAPRPAGLAAPQPVVTPPRPTIIRAPVARSWPQHHGCVLTRRSGVTAPVTPPRPVVVKTQAPRRRARVGVFARHGLFVQTGGATTLITTPATGYVTAGDQGTPAAGSTGPPGIGGTGTVSTGSSGNVTI